MPKKKKLAPSRVFISYARKDGATLAERLQKDLTSNAFDAWLDKNRLKGGSTWTTEIENALDEANCVLAVLTPGSYVSEICRAEQLRALRKGKVVIPVLAQRKTDIPLHLEAKNYRDFSSNTGYKKSLDALLKDIQSGNGVSLKRQFRETYVTVPPLPINFLDRPDAITALRNALITDDGASHIGLTALQGMGGIGKTVLAQALCRDEVVQQAFPDGIAWVTVGREAQETDTVSRLREIGKALGDDLSLYDTEVAAKNQYRSTIRGKAALVVIDDVWQSRDLEPFLADDSPRSRLLFTTRDANIAAAVGAREHLANLLSEIQSREMLARWSATEEAKLPSVADQLIRECGGLPLALSMTGAMLRNKPPAMWAHVYSLFRSADLEKIRAQFPGYPYVDVLRAIQVSVDGLDAKARERYVALAVLPEDTPVSAKIQQHVWGVDEGEALETAEQFVSLSLAQRDQWEGNIKLHDLQLDYIRKQHPDPDVLSLLQGAVRLSSNVIAKDPDQFTSQIVGRLLLYQSLPAVARFLSRVIETTYTPWLRPLQPTLHPPGTPLIRTLEGHTRGVARVALSPDAQMAVSACEDGTVKVWDIEGGRELHTLKGHIKSVEAVAMSSNKRVAISASDDKTLKVWDLANGNLLRTLESNSSYIRGLALSGDGTSAISVSAADSSLKMWDVTTGQLRCRKDGAQEFFLKDEGADDDDDDDDDLDLFALSADAKVALSVSYDNQLTVWEVDTGRVQHTLSKPAIAIVSLALSADGRRALCCSRENSHENYEIILWDIETGRELHSFSAATEDHNGIAYQMALSADGRIAAAPIDTTVRVWEVDTGRELNVLRGHSDHVEDIALSRDGRILVSASRDHTLKIWKVESGTTFEALQVHSGEISGVASSRDGRVAVSASEDGTLKGWEVETGRELRTLDAYYPFRAVSLSGDGQVAVALSTGDENDDRLTVWQVASGQKRSPIEGPFESVRGVAISEDGKTVAACEGYSLQVWNLRGRKQRHFLLDDFSLFGVALNKDGTIAVCLSPDNTLKVWDIARGKKLRVIGDPSEGRALRLAMTPDGRIALTATEEDAKLHLWDLESGRKTITLTGHTADIAALALSTDGRRAISASEDNTVRLWDLQSAKSIAAFTCDGSAQCCTFAGDSSGAIILVGDSGGHLHFLRVEQPQPQK